MKVLETTNTAWIEDMAACIREFNHLIEAMDRELSHFDERYPRERARGPRVWGEEYGHDPRDSRYGTYRGEPMNRFTRYVRELQDKSQWALKAYDQEMK